MTSELSIFAARVADFIAICAGDFASEHQRHPEFRSHADIEFNGMALMLFTLQFEHNPAYRKLCQTRKITPADITHWKEIPAVPTSAFKDLEISCLSPEACTHVFHSSGTTVQKPSRHFHNAESLAIYEKSLLAWFKLHVERIGNLLILTPPPSQAPNSSLVHMFETIRREFSASDNSYHGVIGDDGLWSIDFAAAIESLENVCRVGEPVVVLGTAFSYVHLMDYLAERQLNFQLPKGSRAMETGGYKNRSRILPKPELHELITRSLGVPRAHILCEYGMSELSSQAYYGESRVEGRGVVASRFQFPPWARAKVISAESGREINDGEAGLLRVFDLANVFSTMAIQTEDLAIRRGDGFELVGRAEMAEARGCSLMSA